MKYKFKTFLVIYQEVIYLLEQRLKSQKSSQLNFECGKEVCRASSIYVHKNNIKKNRSHVLTSIQKFFIQTRDKMQKFLFFLTVKGAWVLLAKWKECMVIQKV